MTIPEAVTALRAIADRLAESQSTEEPNVRGVAAELSRPATRESRIEAALRECVDAGEAVAEAKSVVEAYLQMGRLVSAIKAGRAALAPGGF